MKIIKAYYYFFYKIYKLCMAGAIPSLSRFYAGTAVMALEIWFLLSLYIYYTVFINRHATLEFKSAKVLIPSLIIIGVNYISFSRKSKWLEYVNGFEEWPPRKNIIGGVIVWSVVVLIIANMVFSFYLMSQIDWKQYR